MHQNKDVMKMKLTTPQSINEQQEVLLQFVPTGANNELVELEVVHEQKLHLIIVNEDLSFFSHLHPKFTGNAYELAFTFPKGGRYLLYADYKAVGYEPTVDQLELYVEGATDTGAVELTERLVVAQDGITVELNKENLQALKALVYKDGAPLPASGIDDFLGAKAHVVMIHTESKEFLHVHPMVHDEELVLHAHFNRQGSYRVWVQFLIKGRLYTTDFVLQVEKVPHKGMAMHHHH
jgi:hypothetical protein